MNSAIRILIRHLQCAPTLTEGVSKLFTLFFKTISQVCYRMIGNILNPHTFQKSKLLSQFLFTPLG